MQHRLRIGDGVVVVEMPMPPRIGEIFALDGDLLKPPRDGIALVIVRGVRYATDNEAPEIITPRVRVVNTQINAELLSMVPPDDLAQMIW